MYRRSPGNARAAPARGRRGGPAGRVGAWLHRDTGSSVTPAATARRRAPGRRRPIVMSPSWERDVPSWRAGASARSRTRRARARVRPPPSARTCPRRGCSCRRDRCRRRAARPPPPRASPSGTARTAARDTARHRRGARRPCRAPGRSRSRRPARDRRSAPRLVRNCDIPALITGQIVVQVVKMKLTSTGLSVPIASRSVVARPFWSTKRNVAQSPAAATSGAGGGRRRRRGRPAAPCAPRGPSCPPVALLRRQQAARNRPSPGSRWTTNSPIVTVTVLPAVTKRDGFAKNMKYVRPALAS